MIYVMNHHSRDPSYIEDAIKTQGYEYKVKTDHTNFSRKRDSNRYRGLNQNFLSIMLEEGYTNDWKIVLHDDISVPEGALEKMYHISEYAPKGTIVSFFNAPNVHYDNAYEQGHRVLRTYTNIWYPAALYHREFCESFAHWMSIAIPNDKFGMVAEDALIPHYLSQEDIPVYAIVPSLVQHEGFDKSIHKNPAKVGGRYRVAYHYDPEQTVYDVDWKGEFANPYSVMSKYRIKKFDIKEG